ncbi:hypothetical protein BOTCAL_0038g00060 [Botryotinia calthae]|uniref:Uncharacterized protein n=1 Tax=Botryotinia calthae TaxID=38488 RepID=A0A4Y8DC82_9HELO|nr:hypothetical protein BOTCAL_0038g00060 [Botryotinia calthae]
MLRCLLPPEHTSKVDEYLASNNIPFPSFDVSCPLQLSLPPDVQASRNAVLEASDELTALMLGPVGSLIPPCKILPPGRTSTFPEVAQVCSIPEFDARSLIRHAMIKWPGSQESYESGYALVNGTDIPMMQDISKDSRRSQQMGKAMTFLKIRPSESVQRILENFAWVDAANGLVVDVCGAKETFGIELLNFLPKLKYIVQDQLEVVRDTTIPDELQERLSFMAHDFFSRAACQGSRCFAKFDTGVEERSEGVGL